MLCQEITAGNEPMQMSSHLLGRTASRARSTMERQQDTAIGAPGAWQSRAIAAYRRSEPAIITDTRNEMIAQFMALTGCAILPESIFVNPATRTATTVMDGAIFRLVGRDLSLLRPCSYCGTGQFASPTIRSVADLGYALADWEPLHDDCQPEDPVE